MLHCGTKEIRTPRLTLRRFVPEDAPAMFRNWASDPEVTQYLTWPAHSSQAVTEWVLADWVSSYSKADFYQWAIVLRAQGEEPIGCISVVHTDDAVSAVEIGYCLGRAWWRKGIASEALSAVMDFFFVETDAQRVCARHDPANPHSGQVMRKCGMTYEGTLRRADRNNQGICDVSWYSILREERRVKQSVEQ